MNIAEWTPSRLGDACQKPQYGYTASAQLEKIGPKFLRITDLQDGSIDWESVPSCEIANTEFARYRLEHGDVLVARIGATTGNTSIVENPPESVFASYLIRLRAAKDVHPFFLYFYTKGQQFRQWIDANKDNNLKGGVNVPVLLSAPLALPPPEEQEKIAAILWKLQHAIANQDRLVAATRGLKQSTMTHLFTRGLRGESTVETEVGPIPSSWRATTLGELCATNSGTIQTGPFGSQLHAKEYLPTGIPVVNPTHLLGNKINHDEVPRISLERASDLARHALRAGDLLFARRGQIGRHGFVSRDEAGWLCGTGCFLIRVDDSFVANEYLPHYFSVAGVITWLEQNAAGAIMPNLNNAVLSRLPVHLPQSKADQQFIANALATIDRKLTHHQKKRAALNDLFQTLLHKLMSAEIRVADWDIDTSDVTAPARSPEGIAA